MKSFSLLGIALAFLGGWGAGAPVQAATIAVTTTTDEFGTGPDCSLREALEAANTNKAFGGCAAGEAAPVVDTVSVAPGTYALSLTSDGNEGGDLDTNESVTIVGDPANPAGTVVDASAVKDRVFDLRAEGDGTVTLRGLTIRGGKEFVGGGIQTSANNILVESCIIRDNSARYAGGGIYLVSFQTTMFILRNSLIMSNHAGDTDPDAGDGGGFNMNQGTAKIINTTFDYNTAVHKGGGIWITAGSLALANVTITQNSAGAAVGGIYAPFNTAKVRNSIIAFNHTSAAQDTQNCYFDDPQVASGGYNVENANSCKFTATGDLANSDNLQLNPIVSYNGGATPTHRLGVGSDAVDRVADGACTDLIGAPLLLDQRGSPRPIDGDAVAGALCDSGAFELEACGDGVLGAGEVCDPGAPASNDCCSDDCRSFEVPGTACEKSAGIAGSCDNAGTCNVCGDGVVGGSEACDVGSDVADDCCDAHCDFLPAAASCDDGNADTTGDACDGAGACAGSPPPPPVPTESPAATPAPSAPPVGTTPPSVPPTGAAPGSPTQAAGNSDGDGIGGGNPTAMELRGSGCSLGMLAPMNGLQPSLLVAAFVLLTGARLFRRR